MRSLGTVISTSVQADRHGPSITTRSPDSRTRSNSSRNGPTSPPGLDRMRTSARAGTIAVQSASAARASLIGAVSIIAASDRMTWSAARRPPIFLAVAAGNAGLREGGHPGVAGQSRAQQQNGDTGAGGLSQPHVEIEQRIEPKFPQQRAVTGLGRDMPGTAMIK